MDARARLTRLKDETLQAIGTAADAGSSDQILKLGGTLSDVEGLIRQYDQIETRLLALENGSTARSAEPTAEPDDPHPQRVETARRRGERRRVEFLESLKARGIELRRQRGTIFKTASGNRVGIAFATEVNPDRWFLGLQEDAFDLAVLLCETRGEHVRAVSLPATFFQQYGSTLSRSRGQVKFNVTREGTHFFVSVPGIGSIGADQYMEMYDHLS